MTCDYLTGLHTRGKENYRNEQISNPIKYKKSSVVFGNGKILKRIRQGLFEYHKTIREFDGG